jgi:hypothetical protein
MSHFIELHKSDNTRTPVIINIDFIVSVETFDRDGYTYIKLGIERESGGMESLRVMETYSHIKQLLGF